MDFFKILLCGLVGIVSNNITAQSHHDNIWLFSDLSGAVQVDFSRGVPEVSEIGIPIVFENASAQMSDVDGKLLFYTNGCEIYNSNHELMDGGNHLNPGRSFDNICSDPQRGYPSGPQGTVIVQLPEQNDSYLILHKPTEWNDTPINGEIVDIYRSLYSVVDMKANNGLGKVIEKNVLYDSIRVEAVQTLVRHANGIDWWMVSPWRDSSVLSVYLIDSTGIHMSSFQPIEISYDKWTRTSGQDIFSPLGDEFYRYNSMVGIQRYEFDRETGLFSNFELIPMPLEDRPAGQVGYGGIGISPSGQYAYVSTVFTIYQYDLWADDIADSRLTVGLVGNPDSLWVGVAPTAFNFQLGPDCKLYNFTNTGDEHHVIHNPDERGLACRWEQGWLELPFNVFRDQIYFPNFRLGPLGDEGSPCAEPIVGTVDLVEQGREYLTVYPNPAAEFVSVAVAEDLPHREGTWELYDMLGRRVRSLNVRAGTTATLQRDDLAGGMYAWRLVAGGQVVGSGKLLWR